MRRNEIFEIIFGMNPNFVISECDETFFSETIEPEDIESIKERMKNFINDNEPMEHELKVFDFSTISRNGQIISKDAFKDQDGKIVPLKWGSDEHVNIIGNAELNMCEDGVSISISKETYENLINMTKEDSFADKLKIVDEVYRALGSIPKEVLKENHLEEAYQYYMKKCFDNGSRPEFLTKQMNIPVKEENK